jgi:hypothetical protein
MRGLPRDVSLTQGLGSILQCSRVTLLYETAQLFNETIQVRRDYAKQNDTRFGFATWLGWRAPQLDMDANVTSRVATIENASYFAVAA